MKSYLVLMMVVGDALLILGKELFGIPGLPISGSHVAQIGVLALCGHVMDVAAEWLKRPLPETAQRHSVWISTPSYSGHCRRGGVRDRRHLPRGGRRAIDMGLVQG